MSKRTYYSLQKVIFSMQLQMMYNEPFSYNLNIDFFVCFFFLSFLFFTHKSARISFKKKTNTLFSIFFAFHHQRK